MSYCAAVLQATSIFGVHLRVRERELLYAAVRCVINPGAEDVLGGGKVSKKELRMEADFLSKAKGRGDRPEEFAENKQVTL